MIPGLRLIGGIALMYIAYKLVTSNEDEHNVTAASTFWGAMATIVWADAVMGLDNALAIAGAASGNWWLIIFGLLVSVPIILYGSTVVSKIMLRWPKTIWIGAGVLVIVAIQMMVNEPIVNETLHNIWETYK
jgi:YjbE family integral membrane protein